MLQFPSAHSISTARAFGAAEQVADKDLERPLFLKALIGGAIGFLTGLAIFAASVFALIP